MLEFLLAAWAWLSYGGNWIFPLIGLVLVVTMPFVWKYDTYTGQWS